MLLILPPGSAPGYKVQKSSKEYGMFQSLMAPLVLFFFTKRQSQKEGHGTMPTLPNTLLPRILRQGACVRINKFI